MRKRNFLAALAVTVGVVAAGIPVDASPEPSGSDDIPDLVLGGGSDTTYLVHQRFEQLYNAAPGCAIITTNSNPLKGHCVLPSTGETKGNFDHDVMVGITPTGSSAGVAALTSTGIDQDVRAEQRGGVTVVPLGIDYARSSRGPSGTTETNELTFWGFARDAITVLTFGSRTGVSLTRQNLIDIYTCQATADDWSDFGLPAGPIIPWTMNGSSGTFATFYTTYLGNPTPGACVRSLDTDGNGTGDVAPFENDVKPLIADNGPDLLPNTADDNEDNFLWWMSWGNYKSYSFTTGAIAPGEALRTGTNPVTVDGVTMNDANITNGTYTIPRTIFHVTRSADADIDPNCAANPSTCVSNVIGADGGVHGAVREFTEFICRNTTASHATSATSGRNYLLEVGSAISREGFLSVPGALRSPGYACQVL